MLNLIVAFIFLVFVASPAIVAAMPRGRREAEPEVQPEEVDFPIDSLPASR